MSKQDVALGAAPNDGNGDDLRTGGGKINANFNEIYTALGDGTDLDPNLEPFLTAEKAKLGGVEANATNNAGALADKNTVDTGDIEGGAVTLAKLQQVASGILLGRTTENLGNAEQLNPTQVLALLGLSSILTGEGGNLIGFDDPGDLSASSTVSAALAELFNIIDGFGNIVSVDQADVILKDGQDVIGINAGGDPNFVRPPTHPVTKPAIWGNTGGIPVNAEAFDIIPTGKYGVANVNEQTGVSYTLVQADRGYVVARNNAGANTLTIPADSTYDFDQYSTIIGLQIGAGATTINGESGVTINNVLDGSETISGLDGLALMFKIGANRWKVIGDLS